MKSWIITILTIAVIIIVITSIALTVIFGFVDNYKVELWAIIVLALISIVLNVYKEPKIIINIPHDSIKVEVNGTALTSTNVKESIDIEVDKSEIKSWKDVKVGEVSLPGEDLMIY